MEELKNDRKYDDKMKINESKNINYYLFAIII